MKKTWKYKDLDIELKNQLAHELGTSSLFAQLLISRGISTREHSEIFLRSALSDLHDPFIMKGMN
ncbi:MAG TPA: single-stranded-DNA-specific exonuclease RecJ, partial [Candidatus Omnitrophota bacterium]|nr:single-stranded-DNA-specific exonuclease RecJ [Candidatus Omnitrophota bacterium]